MNLFNVSISSDFAPIHARSDSGKPFYGVTFVTHIRTIDTQKVFFRCQISKVLKYYTHEQIVRYYTHEQIVEYYLRLTVIPFTITSTQPIIKPIIKHSILLTN